MFSGRFDYPTPTDPKTRARDACALRDRQTGARLRLAILAVEGGYGSGDLRALAANLGIDMDTDTAEGEP